MLGFTASERGENAAKCRPGMELTVSVCRTIPGEDPRNNPLTPRPYFWTKLARGAIADREVIGHDDLVDARLFGDEGGFDEAVEARAVEATEAAEGDGGGTAVTHPTQNTQPARCRHGKNARLVGASRSCACLVRKQMAGKPNMNQLISVIIPCYNHASYLPRRR